MRKKISELELENNNLKQSGFGSGQPASMQQPVGGTVADREWFNFGGQPRGAPLERPTTASNGAQRVRDLENELKNEKRQQKYLLDEIENLRKEIHKANFSAFTQNSSEVSVKAGRLPPVPGVREITIADLEFGEQIGQGGFSVIHRGFLNGTPVAIKKIFDPNVTEDLLNEIQNEIIMQSILRHPNIALLMAVMP